ncbi:MAG: dockerin type I repeat-containing protein, partial [Verrucomicrobiota bacterium]|nr:dockerin type I repeat-containing protein [Verrucomicrobiota bacterium]
LLPAPLNSSLNQLILEKAASDQSFELSIRDAKSGFVYFNIEGHKYSYDAATHDLQINGGRLLVSEEFAKTLGRPSDAGAVIGDLSLAATMRAIEVGKIVNGAVASAVLPPVGTSSDLLPQFNAGPDVIVGDIPSMDQAGSVGTQVGLEIGTTSCNTGNVELNWFALPNVDHPVIPQNFYRMSGGAANSERFEQIGQSWLKHAFTALQNNACNFGCTPAANGTHLGVGCSDPYSASLNGSQSGLGSRAWVNPFTGVYPSTARDHTNHTHTALSHRVLVNASDLNTTTNVGATYYAEAQYVTPHEYAWCQTHAGQCNMYNNASYRRFNVTGTTSFTFSAVGATVTMTPAVLAWTGSSITPVEPAPGQDGRAFVAYKVSGPVNGVYHYEYAINNQNLDRSIQSFSVPLGCGVAISNVDFHAPLNEQGWPQDGTVNSAGYSNTPWSTSQTASSIAWSSETFAQNPNANAIRWGTLYNFRFDSPRPPQAASATVGFYKTGAPVTVNIQAPTPDACNPLQLTSAFSRKTHTGAGNFDVSLPLSGTPGVESRSGGANGNHTLIFAFANNVVSGTATVLSGTGSMAGNPTFSGNLMTVNVTGVSDAQTIAVKLSNVTDEFSQTLPDTNVSVSFLLGDTNGDGVVNVGDAIQTRNRSGQAVDNTNFRSDVNTDGFVNTGDSTVVRSHSGDFIP